MNWFGKTLSGVVLMGLATSAGSALAQGNPQTGARLFKGVCYQCHRVEEGQNLVGPSLYNVVGRKAGAVEGFTYSEALLNSGIVWTEENIDKYIANPNTFIPGNKMAYAGLRSAPARAHVIAYLVENSPGAQDAEAPAEDGGQ